jgi:hypothetical protein
LTPFFLYLQALFFVKNLLWKLLPFHRQVCEQNTIVNMDTGLGKTLIAVMSHPAMGS